MSRAWPALDIRFPDPQKAARLELLQAALSDYAVDAIDETVAGLWRIYLRTAPERDRAAEALPQHFPDFSFDPRDVVDDDWAARSQASLRSVRVGRVIVAPPWDVPSDAGSITIQIQPSMGFGTGHHATTRLCLAGLQRLDLHGRSVLDVGTGSGVLAIAATRLGAREALGIDDDADAIACARENVELNDASAVTLRVADLRSASLSSADVVVANLTGGVLQAAAGRLRELTRAGGYLMASGFLTSEEHEVRAAYSGCAVEWRAEEDEWVCVALRT